MFVPKMITPCHNASVSLFIIYSFPKTPQCCYPDKTLRKFTKPTVAFSLKRESDFYYFQLHLQGRCKVVKLVQGNGRSKITAQHQCINRLEPSMAATESTARSISPKRNAILGIAVEGSKWLNWQAPYSTFLAIVGHSNSVPRSGLVKCKSPQQLKVLLLVPSNDINNKGWNV